MYSLTPEKRSDVMSRIRSRGNRDTEVALAKLFRRHHISGWRRHLKVKVAANLISKTRMQQESAKLAARQRSERIIRPDFVFPRARVVVFVDGCFWHGCPKHSKLPENNRVFWEKKLTANKTRDRRGNRLLRAAGWEVVHLWEHDLAKRGDMCVRRVGLALSRNKACS